ncbi:hypothetical protein [Leptolyngbya sp. NIES-2104]|uniref:hypothetical protein n=1 Tax=Leptolyngbya sp. NIES-2104 TaxID=1552121 RepID=UPI0006ECB090|nr:hypothetical protein [Leptolyngbya sp. NIES-2104]GAQ00195.1 hypothetical protein NIES2104_67600 [Leptolyngbya sp. NIES-2104]
MAQSKNSGSASNEPQEPKEPDLNGALEDLKKLAEKPKKISPEEVVRLGFEQIEIAIKQGYSYTDIRKIFVNRGVQISIKDLKNQYEAIAKTKE